MVNRINIRRSGWRVLNELTVIAILFLLVHVSTKTPGNDEDALGTTPGTSVQELDSSSNTSAPASKSSKVWGINEHVPINGPITSGHASSVTGTSKASTPVARVAASAPTAVPATKIVINHNGQAVPQEFVLP